ncbi:MAG: thioredoxin family protein [Prolixibacteraceae bacterium]|nr:thioredoxin family protein [Prolixibacteraceae bacterium]
MKTISVLFLMLVSLTGFSQIYDPVKWELKADRFAPDSAIITMNADIEKGWHIYSQVQDKNEGPVPSAFEFAQNSAYKLVGKTEEPIPLVKKEPAFDNATVSFFEGVTTFSQKIALQTSDSLQLGVAITFMACNDEMCLPPDTRELTVTIKEGPAFIAAAPVAGSFEPEGSNLGIWAIFFAGFAGGLLALLTPCVFPMLPLTVSFFTKQSKTRAKGIRNAMIYAVSIIVIYVSLGLVITLSLGPDALNALASNGIMNFAFFLIFVVFALSFFGAFEITLPSKWLNASDKASEKGGLIGIFFMAFTLSLVSFSCTGPIIGSLLVQAAVNGNVTGPAIGMLGFAVALALPFALFAAFPGWLNSLPKSGGWLNSVKVILGFIELAFALKFLSAVDLAYHWGILTREVFIALWIVIFSLLGFYLLGKIRLPHDSEQKKTSIPGLVGSVLIFGLVVYMLPGMWGAPLKLISGFPPPSFYNEGWSLQGTSSGVVSGSEKTTTVATVSDDEFHCPHGLNCFHDYEEGMAYAQKVNKPVILDFTGWSCVNCRKMEDNVWSDKNVLSILTNDYVLISLYVDDKTTLPENEQYISETTKRKVKTIGNKWSDFQATHFRTNAQPFYVLIDHDGKMLAQPKGYDTSIEGYVNFLTQGLKNFNS